MPASPSPVAPAARPDTADLMPRPAPPTRPALSGGGSLAFLLLVVACVTTADLLLKRGAVQSHAGAGNDLLTRLGLAALGNPYTLAGILCHLAGLAAWLMTLRRVPLTVAYCFTAVQQATIALGAWWWLGEMISPLRWLGIAIVVAGVLLLVPSIVQAEKLAEPPGMAS